MSRWGNFLHGIESGLDKILAEENSEIKPDKSQAKQGRAQTTTPTVVSRSSSTKTKTDLLQERLAKAVDSTSSSSPHNLSTTRTSGDSNISKATDNEKVNLSQKVNDKFAPEATRALPNERDNELERGFVSSKTINSQSEDERTPSRASIDSTRASEAITDESEANGGVNEHYLLERIEALQARLDLYIQEASTRAKDEANNSEEGSQAQMIAKQDLKITSLISEGEALSRQELRHLSTIRRLHTRLIDTVKRLDIEKKTSNDAQRDIQTLKLKVENAEVIQKADRSKVDNTLRLEKQLNQAKQQMSSQAADIVRLRKEHERKDATNLQAQVESFKSQLDANRMTISNLKDELDNAKIEIELAAERYKSQLEDRIEKSDQAFRKATLKETELYGEIRALESRLETVRSRNEEAAGGPIDGQAKQLRQIEALQRQYSVSKENWNGIETSLNARIASLEHEKYELSRKEGEIRKKFRETAAVLRKSKADLDESNEIRIGLEEKLQSSEVLVKKLQLSLNKSKLECGELQKELNMVKEASSKKNELAEPDQPNVLQQLSSADAPTSPSPLPKLPMHSPEIRERRVIGGSDYLWATDSETPDILIKTSTASQQLLSHSPQTLNRQLSNASVSHSSSRSAMWDAQSTPGEDNGERLDNVSTPATLGKGFGDIRTMSASTPAAGPSVQLVERMSLAVRRLESERASTRDELERMSSERDEARKEVILLLEEVELKRSMERKISELETEIAQTAQRYQATLELLGERSETVDELKADIADMKQIYREALERSMK